MMMSTRSRATAWIAIIALTMLGAMVPLPGFSQTRLPTFPELFVYVDTSQTHVQQQVVQRIRLQSPDPFDALTVQLGIIADAEVIELQRPSARRFEAWGTRGYVWESTRAIFPEKSGELMLPAISAKGRILRSDGSRTDFDLTEPAHILRVAPRETSMRDDPWLVAKAVEMSERWSPEPTLLKTGDIARRTIEVTVNGVNAERIPDLVMPVSSGISVLPGDVSRDTRMGEQGLIGRMIQHFDVRIETDSVTDISPVQLAWWDAAADRVRRASVRAWRIEPLVSDALALAERLINDAAIERTRARRNLALLALATIGGIALILMVSLRRGGPGSRLHALGARSADLLFGPRVDLPAIDREIRLPGDDQRR